ncbi:DNA-3-methyladenine glycosylase [Allofrancisella guangzhouensis]|uniref:Putative 3-methyladenine DNA glycosylase n=1 Tax=Allofrancisella guangzhouensis TaxID=594679 RepID=A0A0A8E6N8_9GAMM|nr:DNA-3-methyladenine glycosylase [Allofrancisella guangzhouensis]AJC49267.1 3-methyladenine DNA glycosylase [Allofrancisella guangzhouensis]MBK2027710.1 DNA-3-methyladenine glycosylase [Allofrancisella guangzhouensis]MBK2044876.1 DNA-3-methyladenine glycosylase [Allofrancisella guangzhouensis]MBK2046401.1 DNA-3-methyladenine glycosylase [Allofrancisella guangzhouensis]
MQRVNASFFNQNALSLAHDLLGKLICRYYKNYWLYAQIIETEAYELTDKGSHASLGFTPKRKALFMPAGTIYMYYSRGKDSLNISAYGEGCAVLIKSAIPYGDVFGSQMLKIMHQLNPLPNGEKRPWHRLMSGQTLLCRALDLKVPDWDQQQFSQQFFIADTGYKPQEVIQTTRLGIPKGRDEHLPYRFIDAAYVKSCTKNPLTSRIPIDL